MRGKRGRIKYNEDYENEEKKDQKSKREYRESEGKEWTRLQKN